MSQSAFSQRKGANEPCRLAAVKVQVRPLASAKGTFPSTDALGSALTNCFLALWGKKKVFLFPYNKPQVVLQKVNFTTRVPTHTWSMPQYTLFQDRGLSSACAMLLGLSFCRPCRKHLWECQTGKKKKKNQEGLVTLNLSCQSLSLESPGTANSSRDSV